MPVAPAERGVARPRSAVSLHEAFRPGAADRASERVDKAPPPPIVERPGGSPTSPTARWVEGYWEWDGGLNDFIWVTGIWREPAPGTFWVNGYWRREDRGWYRVPGFWSTRKESAAASSPSPIVSTPAGTSPPVASGATAPSTRTVARPPFAPYDPSENANLPSTTLEPLATSLPAPSTATPPQVASVVSPGVGTATIIQSPPPLVALADQLAGQAAAFEQVFGMTASVTPQGGAFLADAQRLRGDALGLRQAVAAGDANRTALTFRDIDITWRRMAARASWISPGRTGPNIQQIWRMGDTVAQIGRGLQ